MSDSSLPKPTTLPTLDKPTTMPMLPGKPVTPAVSVAPVSPMSQMPPKSPIQSMPPTFSPPTKPVSQMPPSPLISPQPIQKTVSPLGAPGGIPPKPPTMFSPAPAAQPPLKPVVPSNLSSAPALPPIPPQPQLGAALQPATPPPLAPMPNVSESPKMGGDQPKKPTIANVKRSPLRFLPILVGVLLLIGGIVFAASKLFGGGDKTADQTTTPAGGSQPAPAKPSKQVTLTYWGLWEPDAVLSEVIKDFEQKNPGVKVNYVKQSPQNYRERLQTAVASGNGPDLFRYHATWVPMIKDELSPMPSSVMSAGEFKNAFYPVAVRSLQSNGKIVGIPLMYDSLGLYYNKELLKAADAQPPKTWAELKTLAARLTVIDGSEIKRGGLAIGNASNVEHFSDILGLLILQNGADPAKPSSNEARDALVFYTNFIKQSQVWSDKLPSSTVAFARGDAAMMLAPSWRAHEVIAMNPDLEFGVVPAPRLGDQSVAWATFWAEGVSTKSKNSTEAWGLLKYLSSKEVLQKLYDSQSKVRTFGEIYPRQDMADMLATNQLVAPFLENAQVAQTWYMSSYTHDNGINDQLIGYYKDAINSVLGNKTADEAMTTVTQGTTQVLKQYGVQ